MRVSSLICSLVVAAFSFGAFAQAPVTHLLEGRVPDPPYTYTFDELKPQVSDGPFKQPYFRFLILFKRKPTITEERFHEHWASAHADLTMSKNGTGVRLSRYVQFHQDYSHRDQIAPMLTKGIALAPYDGIAEFHTKDFQHLKKFFDAAWTDPELDADMRTFVDLTSGLHLMAGYDQLIYGSHIDTSGGDNGVLPNDPRLRPE